MIMATSGSLSTVFFFNDAATPEIYPLSLHDALPISAHADGAAQLFSLGVPLFQEQLLRRSEEHTSELQSPCNLVCRLLLEKKHSTGPRRLSASEYQPYLDLRLARGEYDQAWHDWGVLADKADAGALFFFKKCGTPGDHPPSPPRRSSG